MSDRDTTYTDLVTCPHCGYVDNDSYEYSSEGEWNCVSCDGPFFLEIHQRICYSTAKVDAEGS